MQNKQQFMLVAAVVIAIMAIGLVAIPALNEQAFAGNSVSESKNKGQQGGKVSGENSNGHSKAGHHT